VMKLWARRHRNLLSTYTQVACRLHAVLCALVAGGVLDEIYAKKYRCCWPMSNRTARWPPPESSGRPAQR
jgi:hypothetical protein